jgi:hypothetical protein
MSENLETILKTEPAEAIEEAQPEPIVDAPSDKVDPPSDRLRDDKGRFTKKDETGVENQPDPAPAAPAEVPPTSQGLPKEEYTALKAVRDENKELKREMEALRRQVYAQPQPQQHQPSVDLWDDPQGFMREHFARFGEDLMQRFEQRQTAQRLDASERAAKAKYADYDEAFVAFESAVRNDPRLAVEMAQAADPGEFAYQKGKTALTLQNVGSLEAYEAQLRAKWEAEAKAMIQPTPKPILPSTTAADGSVGGRSGPEWSGPTPLKDVLG